MQTGDSTPRRDPNPARFSMRPVIRASLGLLAALPVLCLFALHLPPVQKEIVARAARSLERNTQYKVELESFTWWPFSDLCLANVRLGAEGRQVLDCREVRLGFRFSWSRPHLALEEVVLDRPVLELEKSAEGRWLIPAFLAKNGFKKISGDLSGGPPVPVPRLRIVSGTVIGWQQGKIVLSVRDITGTVGLESIPDVDGSKIRVVFDNWLE